MSRAGDLCGRSAGELRNLLDATSGRARDLISGKVAQKESGTDSKHEEANLQRSLPLRILVESFFKVSLAKLLKPDFQTLKIKGALKFKGRLTKIFNDTPLAHEATPSAHCRCLLSFRGF